MRYTNRLLGLLLLLLAVISSTNIQPVQLKLHVVNYALCSRFARKTSSTIVCVLRQLWLSEIRRHAAPWRSCHVKTCNIIIAHVFVSV